MRVLSHSVCLLFSLPCFPRPKEEKEDGKGSKDDDDDDDEIKEEEEEECNEKERFLFGFRMENKM